jgi:hypothetical protein
MTLRDIRDILQAEVLCGHDLLDRDVDIAFACDLISEMLAFAGSHSLLITSLTNPHVLHTAEVMDAVGVVFVCDRKPDEAIIEKASYDNLPLLSTPFLTFKSCGLLFANGVDGCIKGSTQ